MRKKQTIISLVIAVILVIAVGYFIRQDLGNAKNIDIKAETQTEEEVAVAGADNVDEGKLPNADAPVPDLDREFSIPDIYGREIIENSAAQYNALTEALKKDPTLRNEWLQLALLRNAVQDYEGAEEIWIYETLRWPLDHVAYGNLGNLYLDFIQNYEKAEKNLVLALERNPSALQYTENLYNLYVHRLGQPEKALRVLLELIKTLPDEVFFPLKTAEHYRDTGKVESAKEFFTLSKTVALKKGQQNVIDYADAELAKLK